jgi:hypothetical protein
MQKIVLNIAKIISVICLIVLLLGKIHFLGKPFLLKESDITLGGYKYGDLYRMSRVSIYKELLTYTIPPPETGNVNDADIFIIGDSFFESALGEYDFQQALGIKSKMRVYDISKISVDAVKSPLIFLNEQNFDKTKQRTLILESSERLSLSRSIDYNKETRPLYEPPRIILNMIKDVFFYADVNYFFRNNFLVDDAVNFTSDFSFAYFRQINNNIGAYSINPNFLFYKEDTDFRKVIRTEEEINETANKIEALNQKLSKFNIKLIYVIIPDKYSVYNEFVNGTHQPDDYLISISQKLNAKGIDYIDLYSLYRQHKKLTGEYLYYKSDTHFNERGREILIDECLKKMKDHR